jgi:hypothetical protein
MGEHATGHPEAHVTWRKAATNLSREYSVEYLIRADMAIPASPTVRGVPRQLLVSSDGSGSDGEVRLVAHEQFRYSGHNSGAPLQSLCLVRPESVVPRKEKDV